MRPHELNLGPEPSQTRTSGRRQVLGISLPYRSEVPSLDLLAFFLEDTQRCAYRRPPMRVILGCVRTLVAVLIAFAVVCSWVQAKTQPTGPGRVRTFYNAAREVTLDYAPGSTNHVTGKPFG